MCGALTLGIQHDTGEFGVLVSTLKVVVRRVWLLLVWVAVCKPYQYISNHLGQLKVGKSGTSMSDWV